MDSFILIIWMSLFVLLDGYQVDFISFCFDINRRFFPANIEDFDESPHDAASHLGLRYLPMSYL